MHTHLQLQGRRPEQEEKLPGLFSDIPLKGRWNWNLVLEAAVLQSLGQEP